MRRRRKHALVSRLPDLGLDLEVKLRSGGDDVNHSQKWKMDRLQVDEWWRDGESGDEHIRDIKCKGSVEDIVRWGLAELKEQLAIVVTPAVNEKVLFDNGIYCLILDPPPDDDQHKEFEYPPSDIQTEVIRRKKEAEKNGSLGVRKT